MFIVTTRERLKSDDERVAMMLADVVLEQDGSTYRILKSRLPHYTPGSVLDESGKDHLFACWLKHLTASE